MVPLLNFLTINDFHLAYILFVYSISYSLGGSSPALQCIGKHNIPVDEKSVQIKTQNFKPFRFDNLDAVPTFAELSNLEGTLYIRFEYSSQKRPIMYAGPRERNGNYTLEHILWRWLEESQPENDFGDIQLPAELHLFFSHIKDKQSAKTALAFPLKVVKNSPIKFFEVITQHLPLVREPVADIELPLDSMPLLAQILNTNLSHFYTYSGDSCHNNMYLVNVTWFDIITPIEIGIDFAQQVEYLETISGKPSMNSIWKQKSPEGIVTKSFGTNGEKQWILAPELLIIVGIILFHD
ncbi:uncharacterized protein [Musca autumnalis]|uniref:uncharacterized protein n=1 Tax=Musca autumnalis TaxID=221902 RepID=UPI003CF68927